MVHFASGQSLSGDPSTVETSVFINAEILKSDFSLKRSLKKVLPYTEAPKHRLVEQEISECPQSFFFCGGGRAGGGMEGTVFLPSPSTFSLLSLRLSPYLHPFLHFFLLSLLSPLSKTTGCGGGMEG